MVGFKHREQFLEISSELLFQIATVIQKIDGKIFSVELSSKDDDVYSGVFCLKNQWDVSFEDGDLIFFSDDGAVTIAIQLNEIEEITNGDNIIIKTKTYIFDIELD